MENQFQPKPMMGLSEAVKTCLSKYVTFTGRARRSEYWFFALFEIIVCFAAYIIDIIAGTYVEGQGIINLIVSLLLLLPGLAVQMRRLHDIGKSGWWILIGLIPLIGGIVLIVFACTDSKPEENQYGVSPKYGSEEE